MPKFSLLNRIEKEEYKHIFDLFYPTMETYIKNKNKKNPQMTDHEILHITNVMENAGKLDEKGYFSLTEKDYFYLLLAICVHDLANGNYDYNREEHNVKVDEVLEAIINENKSLGALVQSDDKTIVCKIAEAHSGDPYQAYNKLADDKRHQDIHLLHISMLLRIADELDITQRRITGYSTPTFLPFYGKESELHWAKHQAIASWEIHGPCVTLYLLPDIIDKFIPECCPKVEKDEFINFMKKQLLKLNSELETVFLYCSDLGGLKWNLKKILLESENKKKQSANSSYIDELSQYLAAAKNIYAQKLIDDSSAFNVQNQKIDDSAFSHNEDRKYNVIGDPDYLALLSAHIKNKLMLKHGCYKHKELTILSWLDSFGFHQNTPLFHGSSNIIAKHIEQQNIDIIIGLRLKGAKIATVVGLKLNKPVLFFVEQDIKVYNVDMAKKHKIAMITDCIITGETAKSCMKALADQGLKFELGGVYSVFLRNNAKGDNSHNLLMNDGDPIFTISDAYTYNECQFEKQECPLYQTYGEKQYERSYKRGKIFSHRSY